MKKVRLIENLVLLLSINSMYFFTTYYQHRIDGRYSVTDIVFDLLFTVILTWTLVTVFARNKSVFDKGNFYLQEARRSILIKWALLILMKCVIDLAIFYFGTLGIEFKYIGISFLSALFWLIGYVVCAKKHSAIWKNKRNLLVFGSVILAILIFGLCYDLHLVKQTHSLFEKYKANSPYLIQACKNMDYLSSVKTFIVDMLVISILIVFHMKDLPDTEDKQNSTMRSLAVCFLRCDIALALFLIICFVKVAFDPQSMLITENNTPFSIENFTQEGQFDITKSEKMVLSGFDVEPSADNSYYYEKTMLLKKGEYVFEEFKGTGKESTCIFTKEGKYHFDSECVEFLINGRKVYLYGQYAICYYQNGTEPRILRIYSLSEYENDEIATQLCKHLLEEGNLFVFEYATEYLIKYDAEFIQPYIERYSQGLFNSTEINWMEKSYYRSDYIIDLAKNYKKY